jgi:hypothetical protein
MLQSLAAVAMAALVGAASSNEPRHRVLIVQLVHRCDSTADCVSRRTLALMKKETERIWSSLDVRIRWIDSTTARSAGPLTGLSVVIEEARYPGAVASGFVLAALDQPATACRWGSARVWVRQVEEYARLVWRGEHAFTTLLAAFADTFLGRALGRVLAHEIGHYLLGTAQHTMRGLMRAQFTPQDLLEDALRPLYGLDSDQLAALLPCRIDQEAEAPLAER